MCSPRIYNFLLFPSFEVMMQNSIIPKVDLRTTKLLLMSMLLFSIQTLIKWIMEKFVNVFSVASSHFFDDFRNFLTIYSSVRGLIILFIVTLIVFYYYRWKRFVNLIDKIPGPPVHPVAPWLGHAILVLDLDRRKFPYGTYVRKYFSFKLCSLSLKSKSFSKW